MVLSSKALKRGEESGHQQGRFPEIPGGGVNRTEAVVYEYEMPRLS